MASSPDRKRVGTRNDEGEDCEGIAAPRSRRGSQGRVGVRKGPGLVELIYTLRNPAKQVVHTPPAPPPVARGAEVSSR